MIVDLLTRVLVGDFYLAVQGVEELVGVLIYRILFYFSIFIYRFLVSLYMNFQEVHVVISRAITALLRHIELHVHWLEPLLCFPFRRDAIHALGNGLIRKIQFATLNFNLVAEFRFFLLRICSLVLKKFVTTLLY